MERILSFKIYKKMLFFCKEFQACEAKGTLKKYGFFVLLLDYLYSLYFLIYMNNWQY